MTGSRLSRAALARVVTSLLQSELNAAGSGGATGARPWMTAALWPEELRMTGDNSPGALPCDSLDLLRLGAAVNEMFHLYEGAHATDLLGAETFGAWLDHIEAAWQAGVHQITFTTSGSTGVPTRCTHTFSHLEAEIRYLAEIFADRTRVLPFVPAHHIYGFLFTAMLPDQLGCPVVAVQETLGGQLAQQLQHGDLLVSFPERWEWLRRTIHSWPEGVAGVVSTAPCPPELALGLLDGGLASFTEVYGSSETAGLAIRRWPTPHFFLMPQWAIEEQHDDGAMLRHVSGLRVRLKDRLNLEEGGGFTLAGRVDAAVQVGGINVYPQRIAALLREQPGVLDASVRLGASHEGGRLKAFVVPEASAETATLQVELEAWANTALAAAERPRSFTFGNAIPKGAMGKDADW